MVKEGKPRRRRITKLTIGKLLGMDTLTGVLAEASDALSGASDVVVVVMHADGSVLVISSCPSELETLGILLVGQLRIGDGDAL